MGRTWWAVFAIRWSVDVKGDRNIGRIEVGERIVESWRASYDARAAPGPAP